MSAEDTHLFTHVFNIQYASKKLPMNGPFNGTTIPVLIPFKTSTNPVCVSCSERPVLIHVLTAVQMALSCLCDGAARPCQLALGSTRMFYRLVSDVAKTNVDCHKLNLFDSSKGHRAPTIVFAGDGRICCELAGSRCSKLGLYVICRKRRGSLAKGFRSSSLLRVPRAKV